MEVKKVAEIRLAVRQLVEFLLRSGDIDSRFAGFDRALEGARIHRRLQKQGGRGVRCRSIPQRQPQPGWADLYRGGPG